MSNCHEDFIRMNVRVSLTEREKQKLRTSRDAIASRIKNHFKSKGYNMPDFKGQGSFSMDTGIRPTTGFYDLDLGVYLKGLGTDANEWPTTETIHNLIFNAVNGQTSIKPIKKSTCVRVVYKSPYVDNNDLSYHIDLPVYAYKKSFWSDEIKTVIALKGDRQWSENSDPSKFTEWFFECCKKNRNDPEQLKRIVKYLKTWKDNMPEYPKMPSGMILTVLAAKNFQPHSRDDVSLIETIKVFYNLLDWLFQIMKPVEPFNDLAKSISENEEDNFMERTEKLIELGEKAIQSNSIQKSKAIWARVFGDRFNYTHRATLLG
jgi:hypothetical protein